MTQCFAATAKPLPPEPFSNQNGRRSTTLVVIIGEIAAQKQIHAQHCEVASRDLPPLKVLRSSGTGKVASLPSNCRHPLKIRRAMLPIAKIGSRDRYVRSTGIALPNQDQPLWIGERQRRKHNSFQHTEDCSIRSNAQCKSHNHNNGKSGIATELPKTVTNIVHPIFSLIRHCSCRDIVSFQRLFADRLDETFQSGTRK